jgi:ubiquitin-protein ligase
VADEADLMGKGGVVGVVEGPKGTPYEGGYFKVAFGFEGGEFPDRPPMCEYRRRQTGAVERKSGEHAACGLRVFP